MGNAGKVRLSPVTHDELREIKAFIDAHCMQTTPFDLVVEGQTPGDDRAQAAAVTRQWANAGATWWMEAMWPSPELDKVLVRIKQNPPRFE